jgi:phage regulator Rha-like protein
MHQLIATDSNMKMTSREIAELVESRHNDVKRSIERLIEKGVIRSTPMANFKNSNNVEGCEYVFTGEQGKRDSIIVVAQLSPEFTARLVDRWQELEREVSANRFMVPNFSDPVAAARAWADAYEARQLAERTKAEIGHRREATAMNTASQAVKKATKLEIELDRAKQYATVKRMKMIYHGQSFDWRRLRDTSAELDIPTIDVFDANYGTVKAYHADVWQEAYAVAIEN